MNGLMTLAVWGSGVRVPSAPHPQLHTLSSTTLSSTPSAPHPQLLQFVLRYRRVTRTNPALASLGISGYFGENNGPKCSKRVVELRVWS